MANPESVAALDEAEGLLDAKDHKSAAILADKVLEGFDRSVLSRAALIRGKALLDPLISQIMYSQIPDRESFREPWTMFLLARSLEPENEAAKSEIEKLSGLLQELPTTGGPAGPTNGGSAGGLSESPPDEAEGPEYSYTIQELPDTPLDVVIVGAGASGVGMGVMLTKVFQLDP